MTPWFDSEEKSAKLRASAQSWLGTRFLGNSCSKGVGVSCQKLAAAIYREVGFCDVEVPEVPMAHARFSRESLLVPWVEQCGLFYQVARSEVQAGDLLGFRLGKVVHHCGVALGPREFVHAMDRIGTVISRLSDPTWAGRLEYVWRPRA